MSSLRNVHKLLDPEIRAKNLRAMNLAARGLYWDVALARAETPDPVFVIGCSRSGTTVTYETIAMSSRLRSLGYEIPEFWDGLWGPHHNGWDSEAASAEHAQPAHRRAARRYFYQRLGQGGVLDKTCINIMRIPYLQRLFPGAKFVYIHRDGRNNISSLIDGWLHDGHFALAKLLGPFPCPVGIEGGRFKEWSFFLPPGWRSFNTAPLEEVCAYQWMTANRLALDASRQVPPAQWIQLRYEDIFERPAAMFREAFDRLDLPFDDVIEQHCATLNARPTSIVRGPPKRQKWRDEHAARIERILPTIAPMMAELGYDIER